MLIACEITTINTKDFANLNAVRNDVYAKEVLRLATGIDLQPFGYELSCWDVVVTHPRHPTKHHLRTRDLSTMNRDAVIAFHTKILGETFIAESFNAEPCMVRRAIPPLATG